MVVAAVVVHHQVHHSPALGGHRGIQEGRSPPLVCSSFKKDRHPFLERKVSERKMKRLKRVRSSCIVGHMSPES